MVVAVVVVVVVEVVVLVEVVVMVVGVIVTHVGVVCVVWTTMNAVTERTTIRILGGNSIVNIWPKISFSLRHIATTYLIVR